MLYDEMPSLSPIIDMKVLDATGWVFDGETGRLGWCWPLSEVGFIGLLWFNMLL
jgi:hypothetical protein